MSERYTDEAVLPFTKACVDHLGCSVNAGEQNVKDGYWPMWFQYRPGGRRFYTYGTVRQIKQKAGAPCP